MPDLVIEQAPPLPRHPRPIVIIGAGGIVRDAHLPAYRKAGFVVQGIYDLDVAKAQDLAHEFGIERVFQSLEAAVSEAPGDAVYDIAVPASAITEILPGLPDGAAALIQKPMGDDLNQARQIRSLCNSKSLTAAINFQMRYAPYVLAARQLVEQGAIGELHDVEVRLTVYTPWHLWTFLEALPRVEILYHSIHYLDVIRSFLGDPCGVYAKTVRHPKMPKLASTRSNLILDYGDTIRANITTNHGHEFGLRHQESYVKWEGTKGAIKATMGLLMNYPQGEADSFEYSLLGESQAPTWRSVPVLGSWFPDAFVGSMSSLMRYLEGSSAVLPTAIEDAFKTMALVEAAHTSSDSGATPVVYEQ